MCYMVSKGAIDCHPKTTRHPRSSAPFVICKFLASHVKSLLLSSQYRSSADCMDYCCTTGPAPDVLCSLWVAMVCVYRLEPILT